MNCPHCNGNHKQEQCPRVKSIEYDDNGNIKKIELRNIEDVGAPHSYDQEIPTEGRLNL